LEILLDSANTLSKETCVALRASSVVNTSSIIVVALAKLRFAKPSKTTSLLSRINYYRLF